MFDLYPRDSAELKSNLKPQTANIAAVADGEKLEAIRVAFPKQGLFAEKDWLLSPDAFPIEEKFLAELEQLGHRLFVFQRACNQLYQLSVKGKQPAWVARYLDAGKPAELIEFSRRKEIRDDLPRVIRPDLILTEQGYIIAEIDSVPGGIGLTGWLNQTYSAFDSEIIGGAEGMLDGFKSVLPNGGDIVISQEAATYRPEMEWTAAQLNQHAVAGGVQTLATRTPEQRSGYTGAWSQPKITSRKMDAQSIDSSNCLICPTFPKLTEHCARMPRAASPSPRPSNRISKRKCGSHSFGCSHCANSGVANSVKSIFSSYNRSSPTPGSLIRRHCRNTRSSHAWRFTIGEKPPDSARKIENFF